MLPAIVKLLLTAVDGEPGVNATVWSVDAPEQFAFVNLWNVTLPVGSGTAAGVPASRFTYALSWTTRPPVPLVTTWLLAVRMWLAVTGLVAFCGVIWMLASTHVLTAFALSPTCASPVARLSTNPPTVTAVEALSVVTPAVAEVSDTEHSPVVPTVLQLAGVRMPGPLTMLKLIVVPAGAFAKPEPSFTFTCPVNEWGVPISFVGVNGEIWMFASTHVVCALALSPAFASPVSRCKTTPRTVTSVLAWTVVTPAVDDVNVTVHVPVVPTVLQLAGVRVPGPLSLVKLIVVPAGAST